MCSYLMSEAYCFAHNFAKGSLLLSKADLNLMSLSRCRTDYPPQLSHLLMGQLSSLSEYVEVAHLYEQIFLVVGEEYEIFHGGQWCSV